MVTISELEQDLTITGREVIIGDDGRFGTTKQMVLTETSVTPASSISLLLTNYLKEIGIEYIKLTDGSILSTADVQDDAIKITDTTINNASQSAHGFFPKLPHPTGLFLKDDMTWDVPLGTGDVTGPDSSTDDAIAIFDKTSGKLIKDSGKTITSLFNNPVISGNQYLPLMGSYLYMGDENTENSIRISNDNGAIVFEVLVPNYGWRVSFIIPVPTIEEA